MHWHTWQPNIDKHKRNIPETLLKDRLEGWQKEPLVKICPLKQSPHPAPSAPPLLPPGSSELDSPRRQPREQPEKKLDEFIAVTTQQEGCGLSLEQTGLHHRQKQRLMVTHITGFSKPKLSKLSLLAARDTWPSSVATGVEKGRKFNCCSMNVPSDSDSSHVSVLMTQRGL